MSNVRCVVRFRPVNKRETAEAKEQKIEESPIIFRENIDSKNNDGIQIRALDSTEPQAFAFDAVLPPGSTQEQAFERIAKPVCNDVLNGYNGTIFVYGQTGSGKTFTMFGPENDPSHPQLMGVIPRAVAYIFSTVGNDEEVKEARISVSFLEIYKEEVIDLMDPSKRNLKIKLQSNGETWVSNLTECMATSLLDVLQLTADASGNRTVSATNMNATSSRSHMLMSLKLAMKKLDGTVRVSKLHFADLAGSEKVRKTGATGATLKEAQKINLSLTQLGQVITGLSEGKKHVPYRDSKLTHILQDSLGGNCRTTLIVNCSPHEFNREETINSLKFGTRCKLIQNKAKVNKIYSNKELMEMVKKLKHENKKLKDKIKKGIADASDLGDIDEDEESGGPSNNKTNKKKKKPKNKNKNSNTGQSRDSSADAGGTHVSHVTGLSTILDSNVDITQHEKYIELNTKFDELSSELRQSKLENVQFEEMRVEYVTKVDNLTQENEKNRKLVFEQESKINELSEIKIKQEFEIRTLKATNAELDSDWKETLQKDLRKMHRTKTKANLEKTALSDEIRELETRLEEQEALNLSKDNDLDRKIAKIKQLLAEIETKSFRVTQLEKDINRQRTEIVQLTNKYESKCDEYKKLETKLEQSETKYEELTLEIEKRTKKMKRKNHALAQRLSIRHNFIAQQYNMLEEAKNTIKRHTWAEQVISKLDNVANKDKDGTVTINNEADDFTMSTKTPPLSQRSSGKSISSMSTGRGIAPALLSSLGQAPKSPGKLAIGVAQLSKFGDNSNAFMKHRQSARMSRIVSGNIDKIDDLLEKDTNLLNAHEYLAGLEKKRTTLTLRQSSTASAQGATGPYGKVVVTPKGKHQTTASLGYAKSVPAPKEIRFRVDSTGNGSDGSQSDVDNLLNDELGIDEVEELAKYENEDTKVRPSELITSESDGFDLDEFGKLIDSNLTAGLEFAQFVENEDQI